MVFPYFFVGTFIEGSGRVTVRLDVFNFPTFS